MNTVTLQHQQHQIVMVVDGEFSPKIHYRLGWEAHDLYFPERSGLAWAHVEPERVAHIDGTTSVVFKKVAHKFCTWAAWGQRFVALAQFATDLPNDTEVGYVTHFDWAQFGEQAESAMVSALCGSVVMLPVQKAIGDLDDYDYDDGGFNLSFEAPRAYDYDLEEWVKVWDEDGLMVEAVYYDGKVVEVWEYVGSDRTHVYDISQSRSGIDAIDPLEMFGDPEDFFSGKNIQYQITEDTLLNIWYEAGAVSLVQEYITLENGEKFIQEWQFITADYVELMRQFYPDWSPVPDVTAWRATQYIIT